MVEDVKNIGGSGYVVQKIKEYWINIYDRNEMKKVKMLMKKMLAIILVSLVLSGCEKMGLKMIL